MELVEFLPGGLIFLGFVLHVLLGFVCYFLVLGRLEERKGGRKDGRKKGREE